MKITFLGTGTSYGVPFVACDCAVCQSQNPRNKRLRASILVDVEAADEAKNGASSTRILIDTTPDLRQQMLRENVRYLSATFWTHWHNDHIIGLDDLRPICNHIGYIPGFADADTSDKLRSIFGYAFVPGQEANFPRVTLQTLAPLETVEVESVRVTPIPIRHGKRTIFAYRMESLDRVLVYATDCSRIPDESRELMRNADVLVLGALRRQPHPAHFSLGEALQEVEALNARRAFFTHIAHDLDHDETNAQLPHHVRLAFDGLSVEI
ncbi:MAG TPA: MBL fold metallo-hydrolase [Abditibacteriaceae bacterium]|nr:MBL fold metallo-hydrolase [Abditibacteriaceae bacterium]